LALSDGASILFRPVTPEDEPLIAEAIRTASPRTLLHRFFTPLRGLAPEELRHMLTIHPAREFCIVGELRGDVTRRIVGGARYVRLAKSETAEIALTVHDDFQGRGIGRHLMRWLIEQGRGDGVRTFVADVLSTNESMLRVIRRVAPTAFDVRKRCHAR
jgi:acetyltransferase